MKNLKSIFLAGAIMAATFSFASTDDSTPISGTYTGTLETKTFGNSSSPSSAKDLSVQFLFNGDTFIYQGLNAKAMGTYTVDGNNVTFTVTSQKGNSQVVESIFSHAFQFSMKDGELMLIGKTDGGSDIVIIDLDYMKG